MSIHKALWRLVGLFLRVGFDCSSLKPAENNIMRNLLFNSYSSTWPLDHDDGSCYYNDTQ